MAKRFEDTEKYRKKFLRGLSAPLKLLWDYILCECDFAGIWYKDEEMAQMLLGKDCKVDFDDALSAYNEDEVRVIPFGDGKKWLIVPFVEFQYGRLNAKNSAHRGVISKLIGLQGEGIITLDEGMVRATDAYKPAPKPRPVKKQKTDDTEQESIHDVIINMYHTLCPSLPRVEKVTKARRDSVPVRVKEIGGVEKVRELLVKVEASDFLTGRTAKSSFRANFDWLFCYKGNWIKAFEGNYDNTASHSGGGLLQLGQIVNDEQTQSIIDKGNF